MGSNWWSRGLFIVPRGGPTGRTTYGSTSRSAALPGWAWHSSRKESEPKAMESDAGHLTDRQLVETIASAWRLATSDIAYIPLAGVEIRERFQQLVAGALTAIQSPAPRMMTLEQGRTIGRALVELNLSKSEAL